MADADVMHKRLLDVITEIRNLENVIYDIGILLCYYTANSNQLNEIGLDQIKAKLEEVVCI